jgi:exodeoxyribonuclease VII large subunit
MQPALFDLEPAVLTVSAVTAYIRQKLEADVTLQDLWLEGEISNWKRAASGHIYFTLKDSGANLRGVIWRSQAERLIYIPQQEGEAVLAHGRISVYEAGGNYQFYVDDLQPLGQGALYAEFERIKARLAAEGLFEAELKKPLPDSPVGIGLVTSPTGAALRDILNVLRRRYPLAPVILAPTQVQGEAAPAQIIAALQAVARQPVDVIILARGGGSLEDLWAFNDEGLARTIAACPIPVVSGVGHEVDFTVADFVADLRAPTPSAAAEMVTPDRIELKRLLFGYQATLVDRVRAIVNQARTDLQHKRWSLERLSPQTMLNNNRQQIDTLINRAGQSLQHHLSLRRAGVNALAARLETLNPEATLGRGYAIVRKGRIVVSRTGQVDPEDDLLIQVSDGEFQAKVSAKKEAL